MTPPDSVVTTPAQIVLLGFMGAGKSTVGPLLAEILGWQFFDADQLLEHREGCTIAELFVRHGEVGFRQLEESTVAELLGLNRTVIALGGGAIESGDRVGGAQSVELSGFDLTIGVADSVEHDPTGVNLRHVCLVVAVDRFGVTASVTVDCHIGKRTEGTAVESIGSYDQLTG